MRRKVRVVFFLVGFLICTFPFFANLWERQCQKDAVATYTKKVESFEEKDMKEYLSKASEYNEILYQSYGQYMDPAQSSILSDESYHSILDISGNGIMGSIEIPKINVNLPIYHGTEDDVLSVGVGHLQGTSFPVGGIDTRSVLTGHRGSPNSKLFTRLDELVLGDLFFIRVIDQTLAYKITEIDVIEPEDVETLDILAGKDLVTLLTCTPYGINSHRLIVTGERIEYVEAVYEAVPTEMMSLRESIFTFVPFILFALGGMSFLSSGTFKKKKRRRRKVRAKIAKRICL